MMTNANKAQIEKTSGNIVSQQTRFGMKLLKQELQIHTSENSKPIAFLTLYLEEEWGTKFMRTYQIGSRGGTKEISNLRY